MNPRFMFDPRMKLTYNRYTVTKCHCDITGYNDTGIGSTKITVEKTIVSPKRDTSVMQDNTIRGRIDF